MRRRTHPPSPLLGGGPDNITRHRDIVSPDSFLPALTDRLLLPSRTPSRRLERVARGRARSQGLRHGADFDVSPIELKPCTLGTPIFVSSDSPRGSRVLAGSGSGRKRSTTQSARGRIRRHLPGHSQAIGSLAPSSHACRSSDVALSTVLPGLPTPRHPVLRQLSARKSTRH